MPAFFIAVKDYFKKYDAVFWITSLFMSSYCLVLMFSVSRSGTDFFKNQATAIIFGYIGAVFLGELDYHLLEKHWKITAILCMGFLLYALFFGIAIEGASGVNAKAWIKLPGVTFQPSELAKIGFIITLATHLNYLKKNNLMKSFGQIMLLGGHLVIPVVISHFQGDDGAAIIFVCIFLVVCFMAGIQMRYFIGVFLSIFMIIPIAWRFVLSEYQKKRITALINLEDYALDIGFQQIQGKISIGSGKIFGYGLFKGPRTGCDIVPVQESDFIFSAAGEELGFIGCMLVVISLLVLIFRTLKIARDSCDSLGSYMCFGFFGLVLFQTIFNIGMCLSLLPVMGLTLPFYSSGGSSAMCLYLGLGVVQSVFSRKTDGDMVTLDKNIIVLSEKQKDQNP
ncbi:MAG: FtsW/RodA/SpoVE family cell cycle protein [Oscillospiraceae bacterium]|jgi:rod shape determining protein RodA|nr:FtsW/RodA/SpoVE family cell cycle protein [Oscillospiraceae bacterium]